MLDALGVPREILVVADTSDAGTVDSATRGRARVLAPDTPGYGAALKRGIAAASGDYILTMDADLSHPSEFVEDALAQPKRRDDRVAVRAGRRRGDGACPSRPQPGAQPGLRKGPGRSHQRSLERIPPLPARRAPGQAHHQPRLRHPAADLVQALRRRLARAGSAVRVSSGSRFRLGARGARVALAWLRSSAQLWMLRNSILAADYDDRAHDSRIPLQRYWQRSRHRHVIELIAGEGPVLDVGCGSSRIIASLPPGSVAVDILHRKLRYARRVRHAARPRLRASRCRSPTRRFPACCARRSSSTCRRRRRSSTSCAACSQPGGRLVLGTPDYANWQWVYIEKLYGLVPGGYKDEHISHYTNAELVAHHGRARLRARSGALHPAGRVDSGVPERRARR